MRLADAISLRSRRRKLTLFGDLMRPTAETTVLDVGVDEVSLGDAGGEGGCTDPQRPRGGIPVAGAAHGARSPRRRALRERYPGIAYIQGDACALPFPDDAFDTDTRLGRPVRPRVRRDRRLYWVLPQSWLGGEATERGELYALRHHLLPLGAYALGRVFRSTVPGGGESGWRSSALPAGLLCGVSSTCTSCRSTGRRESGVPGWFEEQLGLTYECLVPGSPRTGSSTRTRRARCGASSRPS